MIRPTGVTFNTEDAALQRLFDAAEAGCRRNLTCFGDRRVLVEGGGYEKIWLETQPMGGEMYAGRDMTAAANNQLLFMETQRADGRLAGSIQCVDGRIVPQFDKLQGFCFPWHALNMYWWLGEDRAYLDALADTLARFDGWLHRTRSLDGSGCLASFCVYDTGEDNALRYGDAPNYWVEDAPPAGFRTVPMASMDVTSYAFAARDTLREISRIRRDEAAERHWQAEAAQAARAIRTRLWDDARGACFDRDASGRTIPILCHNTLRCMHWGSLSQEMADRFVREHLLHPDEFWTPLPLPSVAANDPAFRNAPENNWSGQCEGLTYQRAILALERYGYEPLVTQLGRKLFRAILQGTDDGTLLFTQQFDPFTGKPSRIGMRSHAPLAPDSLEPCQDAYGPTLLSVLGYLRHIHGIDQHRDQWWFSVAGGAAFTCELQQGDSLLRIDSDGSRACITRNGRQLWQGACGVRVITGMDGQVLAVRAIE